MTQTEPSHAPAEPRRADADLPRFIGRDASWLRFNERVLALANTPDFPLLDRVRFMAIFVSNLDEFVMKRFALMKHRIELGIERPSHDGLSTRQQHAQARDFIIELQARQAQILEESLLPALADEGIRVTGYADLSETDRERVDAWFNDNVFPILTPLAVDRGHRFPFISNLSENLGVLFAHDGPGEAPFARLKVPDQVPRMIAVPREGDVGKVTDPHDVSFVWLEDVLRNNLDEVFPGMTIEQVMAFRVTRGAGLEAEADEGDNIIEHIKEELRQRRFADAVRIETGPDPSPEILDLLLEELEMAPDDVYARQGPLEYADMLDLMALDRPDLKMPSWRPVVPHRLREDAPDVFSVIRERDVFVHHPYDSFTMSVERFVAAAAADPNVLAIKQTLYRTSRDSPFIESLIRAAEAGKAVACLVELRARFDEDKNVQFARQLEDHGVHVAYGVVGLKTHCKCSLVVRREGDTLRRYAHLGTGNYHPGTAQLYTDVGLLTCDPAITEDVADVFNYITGRSLKRDYKRLLIAPHAMRSRFEELIDAEIEAARAGRPARIIAKMNSLEDAPIIERLYEASQAGVPIALIVRGFCCLRPGVPGLSENIKVVSIVGRFLEHSRVYHFAAGHDDPLAGEWLIGSADWMSRNLDDRVELIAPVNDAQARRTLHHILEVCLADRARAWFLQPDGTYIQLPPDPDADPEGPAYLGTFEVMCREAIASRSAHN